MRWLTASKGDGWKLMALAAGPLVAAQVGLLATWDLASRPAATLAWLGAGFAGLFWAFRLLRRVESPTPSFVAGTLAVAVLLRLLALPLPPSLSDDVHRYVWDGRVAGAGENPYLSAPDAAELEHLRDGLWERLPHRQVETVYPPLALTVFSIAARLPAPVYVLKALLALCDIVTCWLLLRIARRLKIPPARTLWYVWSPLPVLEVAGMGHVDALGVTAVSATVLLLLGDKDRGRNRALVAGGTAAAAILAKVVPLVALPVWARASRRPFVFAAAALGLCAVAFAPLAASSRAIPPGYLAFGVSWEFNGPLYEPLWRGLDRLGADEVLAAAFDRRKEASGEHEFWNRFYPFNYPRLHAKILLGLGALAALGLAFLRHWREPRVVRATGMVFGILVLCSATVYPWYVLWLLPWAALRLQPAWLLLSGLIGLSYWPQLTGADLWPWTFLAIWTPFLLTGIAAWARSRPVAAAVRTT